MTYVDVAIVVAVIGVGLLGYHDGLVRALWALGGVLVGTAVGMIVVPVVFRHAGLSWWVAELSLVVLVGCAAGGRSLALLVEKRLRSRIGWTPVPWVDRTLGTVLGVMAGMGFSWMVGVALAGSALPDLAPAADRSMVLRTLDRGLPLSHLLANRFDALGDRTDFPRYVDVFSAEDIVAVPAPPADVVDEPGVVRASHSVLRILTHDAAISGSEGTGFLIAPERLMTAAHVVARSDSISVTTKAGKLPATIVQCDPVHDVAVLDVPGLTGTVLDFSSAQPGDPAAVIGFPDNGPLSITPARVRERLDWQSADIYGEGRYDHDAYSIRGEVHTGNSGGPMVDPQGRVLGVVVAFSRADDETAYVLTEDQVADAAAVGREADSGAQVGCR
ncbi:MarP family serine protease [Nocardioides hankookensis]|uniref:MarP family serine protease n=1 Tax=Nocardioides hankookensis TaxID=443157 RepID=A0ABW1LM37_9ACTN